VNLMARQERALLAGLAVALALVWVRPVRDLFDVARDVERSSGLVLVSALIIPTAVSLFHRQGKRQEARARASAAEALDAEGRATDEGRSCVRLAVETAVA
jgi:triphosphoribosyl-dephospho-CoA synthetase